jgi:hypothetical protein
MSSMSVARACRRRRRDGGMKWGASGEVGSQWWRGGEGRSFCTEEGFGAGRQRLNTSSPPKHLFSVVEQRQGLARPLVDLVE